MSVARWNPAGAVIDENRCLIVGGQDEQLNYMSSGEIYDCQANQWTTLPNDMPTARVGSSAACIDNKIYVIGGHSDESISEGALTNSNVSSEMLVLDVNTMEWEQEAIPMKQSRFASAAVAVGRFIYIFGGVSGANGSIVHAERFNVDSQKWDNLPPMSTKRYGCAAVAVGKKIYIIGGEDGTKSLNTMEVFNIESAQWESGPDMMTPRWGCDAVSIGRFILVIGGEDGNTKNLSTAEVLDVSKPQWKLLPPTMTTPRYGHVAVVLAKSRIVVAGGHDSTEQISLPGLVPKQQPRPQPASQPAAAATATSMLQTPSKLSLPSMSMKAPKLGFFSS
eukprot:CAMPEP_0195309512 /NCGR_PEP_ID=MMETSP0707-20130614/38774_1 /TAXON_ID=33640 /ORGANISM="Asterionellopsis glacialis, Strain CCMP134" /LENGTH=334 /DNA_ID=CAMNT_0040373809 /DNA_START=1 /DNA_END=1005 /DNA_ORIENTATION=+